MISSARSNTVLQVIMCGHTDPFLGVAMRTKTPGVRHAFTNEEQWNATGVLAKERREGRRLTFEAQR